MVQYLFVREGAEGGRPSARPSEGATLGQSESTIMKLLLANDEESDELNIRTGLIKSSLNSQHSKRCEISSGSSFQLVDVS